MIAILISQTGLKIIFVTACGNSHHRLRNKLKNAIGGGVTKTHYKKPTIVEMKTDSIHSGVIWSQMSRFAWPKWGTSNHCGIQNTTPAMVWSYHSLNHDFSSVFSNPLSAVNFFIWPLLYTQERRCSVNTAMPNSATIQGCLVRFNNSW